MASYLNFIPFLAFFWRCTNLHAKKKFVKISSILFSWQKFIFLKSNSISFHYKLKLLTFTFQRYVYDLCISALQKVIELNQKVYQLTRLSPTSRTKIHFYTWSGYLDTCKKTCRNLTRVSTDTVHFFSLFSKTIYYFHCLTLLFGNR